jgi:hypothetical protein
MAQQVTQQKYRTMMQTPQRMSFQPLFQRPGAAVNKSLLAACSLQAW